MDEFSTGYKKHKAMDQEMEENLHLVMMIALLKQTVSLSDFFFLRVTMKTSPTSAGREITRFRKYAFEGEMVKSWVLKFMGDSGLKSLYLYAMKSLYP
jgi:hypothetical protein